MRPGMQAFGSSPGTTRDALIRDHAEIARRIALRIARKCPDWVAREDLIAAGMPGEDFFSEGLRGHDGRLQR